MKRAEARAAETVKIELDEAQIEAIATRVAQLLEGQATPVGQSLVSAAQVALMFGVSRAFVYEHAKELGAIRLGAGRAARLRFRPDVVGSRLAKLGKGQSEPEPAEARDDDDLLPVYGRISGG